MSKPSIKLSLSEDQVLRLRLHAQKLDEVVKDQAGGSDQVHRVIRDLCGLQAQDSNAAALSVRARQHGLTTRDVNEARVTQRSIVREWLMRGTLHLAAAEDIGWLLRLLGPYFERGGQGRRSQLGLDEETGGRGVRVLVDLIEAKGAVTREEIRNRLAEEGIPSAGQATFHLIGLAALQGLVCYGPELGKKESFVLLKDWIDSKPTVEPGQALPELAQRYLQAYAPAAPEDFSAWSGLPIGQARQAWQELDDRLAEVQLGSDRAWMLNEQLNWLEGMLPGDPFVNLLPAFDTYWMGYRSRFPALDGRHARQILPGGGVIHPALLVNGKARGRWRLKKLSKLIEVIVEPFEQLGPQVLPGLEAEVADLAHYLGVEARLRLTA